MKDMNPMLSAFLAAFATAKYGVVAGLSVGALFLVLMVAYYLLIRKAG